MKKLVSIIIPMYNAERWIEETISSAFEQTWGKKEIIIIDDGSTDKCYSLAKKYESRYVKLVKQENRGASSARNLGLSIAQGDYIQWLDADDLLAPDKISQQIMRGDEGLNCRVLLLGAFGKFYFRTKAAKLIPNELWRDHKNTEWLYYKLSKGIWVAQHSWLVSRRLTDLAGPWNERLSLDDDGEYFCRVVRNCEKVKFIGSARCYYRFGNIGSLSKQLSDRALDSLWASTLLCIRYLRELEESERTKRACLALIKRRIFYFYPDKQDLIKQAENLARELGEHTLIPLDNWKHRSLRKIVGWKTATTLMNLILKQKAIIPKYYDYILYKIGW